MLPVVDVGAGAATAASRDYVLDFDLAGAPLLNIFGGKITTYRKLAEAALHKLSDHLPPSGGAWTSTAPLPGGDFPVDGAAALAASLTEAHPFLSASWAAKAGAASASTATIRPTRAMERRIIGGSPCWSVRDW